MSERQTARMSKIKNIRLDQFGAAPFEQQQFGTAGVEGVKAKVKVKFSTQKTPLRCSHRNAKYCSKV